jgi:hypothetical protein
MGELAIKILSRFSHEKRSGKIIQGFKNTAYIKTLDDELICLTSYDVRAPMNLNFKGDLDFRSLDYFDAEVIKRKNALYIKGTTFNIRSDRQFLRTKQFDIEKGFYERALFAAKTLSLFDLSGSLLDSRSPFFQDLTYLTKLLSNFVCNHNFVQVQGHLTSLIGLGNGFTPSGDDFLVGFLFCLNQLLICRCSSTTNFGIIGSTNWVSKKFIEYSQAGYVIEPLEKFVNSLFSESPEELILSTLTDLIKIGHSSGIDTTVGALFATALDQPKEF